MSTPNRVRTHADRALSMLVVDDDHTFCHVLAESMAKRGLRVNQAHNAEEARRIARADPPEFAVIDLKMPGLSGLGLVDELRALDTNIRIVMLTAHASIATAVEAIKLGAVHYLAKPADADEILAAFGRDIGVPSTPVSTRPLSINRRNWEYIQFALQENGGNISATARSLGIHRRTLQRKLVKRPARD